MRFITEFKENPDVPKDQYQSYKNAMEGRLELHMGNMIADSFGWNCRDERHHLEIEAFPMDKWIEFKEKLFKQLHEGIIPSPARNEIQILKLIKELESFGKKENNG